MTEFKDVEQSAYTPDQDPNRLAFERAVVERMKESGFLEIEIRTECLTRCRDGYNDEIINAGWHYWQEGAKASAISRPAIDIAKHLDEIRNGTRDGFVSNEGDPQGTDPDLACPCCGGSGHKDDVVPISDEGLQSQISEIGNQIHNLSCEYQNDEPLSERLQNLRGKLWDIAKLTPKPVDVAVWVQDLLSTYDQFMSCKRNDADAKALIDTLIRAACFAGQAYEDAMSAPLPAHNAPAALLRAFLIAVVDWKSSELDRYRAKNRVLAEAETGGENGTE